MLPDKDTYLEFWGYTPGTPEAEEAWEAKVKMMSGQGRRLNYMVQGDTHYDGLMAPDGADISSRTKHKEYLARTGYVMYDDNKEGFAKAQAQRDAYHSGERGTVSRKDIERSIAKLTGQY